MSDATLRVAAVQHACGPSPDDNLAASLRGIAQARREGAELVVLQELHCTEYFCREEHPRHFDAAEPLDGPTCRALSDSAREHECVVVGSIFEHRAPGLAHNTAVVFDPDGSLAGFYRKTHIPDDPGYFEKFYFTPGDTGFAPIRTRVGQLGVLVCWDQWFPEAARLSALHGAELLIYPSAIGYDPGDDATEQSRQLDAWITVQRAHAIANGLPLIAVNRVGREGDASTAISDFWGHSFVCGPQGEMIETAGTAPQVLIADIDRRRTEQVRRVWPFLRDRRIDAYDALTRRFADATGEYSGNR